MKDFRIFGSWPGIVPNRGGVLRAWRNLVDTKEQTLDKSRALLKFVARGHAGSLLPFLAFVSPDQLG